MERGWSDGVMEGGWSDGGRMEGWKEDGVMEGGKDNKGEKSKENSPTQQHSKATGPLELFVNKALTS